MTRHQSQITNHQSRARSDQSSITIASLAIAATILTVPLMYGGLITQTLPVLVALVTIAFLTEIRRVMAQSPAEWHATAPWLYVWLAISAYLFLQPAVRELTPLTLTLNGHDISRVYWLQPAKYWAFFTAYWLLAWTVSRQHGRARALVLIAVIAMALFQSLYGTLAFVGGQETILGIWPKEGSTGSVAGTFHNRNHLAAMLAVAMPLCAAWLMTAIPERGRAYHQAGLALGAAAAVLFLIIAGAALIGTASRLGILSAGAGLLLWGWLHARHTRPRNRLRYLWLAALVGLPLLAALWFGPDRFFERLLALEGQMDRGRLLWWEAMLAETPFKVWLHGVSAGGFHDVFKLMQPATHGNSVWRAHNEYLQLAFEFGLIGIALVTALAAYWIKRCRPRRLTLLQCGALAGVIAVLIHNTAEFNMQIPGTAIIFWTATGILFNQSQVTSHKSQVTNHRSPARRAK